MKKPRRSILTRNGSITFPAYIPVTTFGKKYPLDDLIRPYLARLAPGVMVSYHYARQMPEPPRLPLLVDSGGFASLFKEARIAKTGRVGVIRFNREDGTVEELNPKDVLDLQEQIADLAFTLDFPIPPGCERREARLRLDLTVANAHWGLANRRRRDLPLFACVQGWDVASFRKCARAYAGAGFDGIAIGGLVPRSHDTKLVLNIVEAVRAEESNLPLHVFGIGKPDLVELLFRSGVDSVDSSSYVKLAAAGRLWTDPQLSISDPSPTDRLHLALCNLAAACTSVLPLSTMAFFFSTPSVRGHLRSQTMKET